RHFGVPRRLPVIMGVHIDETGGDDLAGGIDLGASGAQIFADRDDAGPVDCDVRDKGVAARSVDDRAAANHQIMHIRSPDYLVSWRNLSWISDMPRAGGAGPRSTRSRLPGFADKGQEQLPVA